MKRREFIKKAGAGAAAAVATTAINAPYVIAGKKTPIRWRMQTYAGAALAAHVCKPSIDAFNKAANGEMVIELYNADQLVPTGELFRAMQRGTIKIIMTIGVLLMLLLQAIATFFKDLEKAKGEEIKVV